MLFSHGHACSISILMEMDEEESQRLRRKRALPVNSRASARLFGARVNSHSVHTDVLDFQ